MGEVPAVEWRAVSKIYQKSTHLAVDDISIEVSPGSVFGIFGRNGSGKSTLMKMAVGLLQPSSGQVLINGTVVNESLFRSTNCVSYMPQSAMSLNSLTVREAISWMSKLAQGRAAPEQAEEVVERLSLSSLLQVPVRRLSGGQSKLVQFAVALASNSALLILDEPTNELDSVNRRLVWDEVARQKGLGRTVVVVSHNIAEAESVVTDVCIMDKGAVVTAGSTSAVISAFSDLAKIEVGSFDLASNDGLASRERQTIVCRRDDVSDTLTKLLEDGHYDIKVGLPSLEDVFLGSVR